MKRSIANLCVVTLPMLSLAAVNTGKIANPNTNENRDSTCTHDACKKIVTHRCYCIKCDSTPTGSECPCVQNNSGNVQQTIYKGQCVEINAKVAAGYEALTKSFTFGVEVSGKVKFCFYNSTPSTVVFIGPVCTL